MKLLNVFLSALVLFSVCLTVSSSAEEMSDSLLQAKQMEYMQLGQPGPEHAFLKKLTGSWDMHISYWMSPNTEPMVLKSSGENKMILGGRFLELTSKGEFMGQTMETITMMGFDRRSKQYTSTGFDSQGTYSVSAAGEINKDKTSIRMHGADYDAFWDFTQEYFFDITIKSENEFTWSVTFTDEQMAQGQDEFKMVEIIYTRKK